MSEVFNLLKEGLEDAILHEQGQKKLRTRKVQIPKAPSCYPAKRVKKLRSRFNCSQSVFAELMNVSVKTVQSWESGERCPSQPAIRLLQVYEEGSDGLTRLLSCFNTEAPPRKPYRS